MWKQRSRNNWLKDGDSNTKFFHSRATQRNKQNYILGLEGENRVWVKEESQMGNLVEDYFSNLFSTSNPTGFDEILEVILPKVSEEMNLGLNQNFIAEEVHADIQQMAPLLAPKPSNMFPIFYKSFWHIVGENVTKAALAILNEGDRKSVV